ncbi:hypothetical protein [Streptomyces viridosporus]|uniref:hypothetical protein n=1 Tax=Streptomyces viridosporus TaxID=67581 RepID=UPI0009C0A3FE|nr:hypothetical protein [Streptomyces viridosporus]
MAHDCSFTVDDSGNITDRRDDGHGFSTVSAGETVGRPAEVNVEERLAALRRAAAHADDGPKGTRDSVVNSLLRRGGGNGTAVLAVRMGRGGA